MQMLARTRHPRAVGLAAIGLGAIVRGLAYIEAFGALGEDGPDINGVVIVLTADGRIPIHLHAFGWIITGIVCLVAALTGRYERFAANLVGAAWLAWGLAYAAAWLRGIDPSAWVSAGTYLFVGALILAWTHLKDPVRSMHEGE